MDEAAAKRAAAAEARRQKILARGTDRLNRITVGTPLPPEAAPIANTSVTSEAQVGAPPASTAPAIVHMEPNSIEPGDGAATSTFDAVDSVATAATIDSASGTGLQPALDMDRGEPGMRGLAGEFGAGAGGDPAAQAAAQREADQALHMLLNQLAGAAALMEQQQRHAAGAAGVGDAGSGASQALPGLSSLGNRAGPLPARGIPAGRANGAAAATAAPRTLPPFLATLLAVLGALLGACLGPQLSAAVDATRQLRCIVALAAAAALYGGLLEAAALRLPPVLALLAAQVALIAGARLVIARTPSARLRLSKSHSRLDLAGGAANGDDESATTPSAAAPAPPPRFDWLSLAPGLRPLLDSAGSAVSLVSGLAADVSMFLTTYLLLGAAAQLSGGRNAR